MKDDEEQSCDEDLGTVTVTSILAQLKAPSNPTPGKLCDNGPGPVPRSTKGRPPPPVLGNGSEKVVGKDEPCSEKVVGKDEPGPPRLTKVSGMSPGKVLLGGGGSSCT